MPTDEENVQYLYQVLTAGGPLQVDWEKISEELGLKKGATTKRWSRLKAAMAAGKDAGPSAYQLLWLCLKHSTRDKAPDWNDIAAKCNTTPGAASKRYSRMKQAFESGAAAPVPTSKISSTDDKNETKTNELAKRKRGVTSAKAKKGTDSEIDDIEETKTNGVDEEDNADEEIKKPKAKRARTTAAKKKTGGNGDGEENEKPKVKRARATATVPKNVDTKVKEEDVSDDLVLPGQSLLDELEAQVIKNGGALDDGEGEEQFLDPEEAIEQEEAQAKVEDWLVSSEV